MSPTRLGRHILRLECCITENGFFCFFTAATSACSERLGRTGSRTLDQHRESCHFKIKDPSEETLERFKDEDEEKSTTRQSLGVFQVVSGRSTTLTSRTQSGVEVGPNVPLEMHNKVLMSFSCKQELKSLYFSRSEEVTNAKIKVKSSHRES